MRHRVGVVSQRGARTSARAPRPAPLALRDADSDPRRISLVRHRGPVTSFLLDLEGIDSSGKGGGDIMELIVRDRANRKTTMMVLDSFMNGFIHQLYMKKWYKYGRRIHYARRGVDACIIVLITYIAFATKVNPYDLARVADVGDVPFTSLFDLEACHRDIIAHVTEALVEQDTTVLGDGGDHSITYPLLSATAARFCDAWA